MDAQSGPWLTHVVPLLVLGAVLLLRLRFMRRARRLRLEALWIMPAIFVALVGIVVVTTPPAPAGWAVLIAATVLGALAGWWRGRATRITIDPVTHRLSQRASPAALLFVVLIVVARNALRIGEETAGGFDPELVTDGLIGFGLGLICVTRLEWFLRGRALLRDAREGGARPSA